MRRMKDDDNWKKTSTPLQKYNAYLLQRRLKGIIIAFHFEAFANNNNNFITSNYIVIFYRLRTRTIKNKSVSKFCKDVQ